MDPDVLVEWDSIEQVVSMIQYVNNILHTLTGLVNFKEVKLDSVPFVFFFFVCGDFNKIHKGRRLETEFCSCCDVEDSFGN